MSYNPQNPNGQATSANSEPVVIASDQSTIPVSVSGVATAANQSTANTSLASIDSKLSSGSQKSQVVDGSGNVIGSTGNALDINIKTSAVTQTISGTVTANAGTNLNTSALALDATLTGGTQKSKLVDSGGTNVATVSAGGALKVDGSAVTQPVSGTLTASNTAGDVASGSADSGNPVKVAGKYNSTKPTFADGQRGDLQIGTRGSLGVQIMNVDGTAGAGVATPADGVTGAGSLSSQSQTMVYNGSTWDRIRSDGTTGGLAVGGTVAAASADSGNPVKVGAKYNSTRPTYTDGQRGDLQIGTRGSLSVQIHAADGLSISQTAAPADAATFSNGYLQTGAAGLVYNGSNWDRVRAGPTTGSVLVSPPTATGAAVPANAFFVGGKDTSGNLQGLSTLNANGDATGGGTILGIGNWLYNGSTWDRVRSGGVTGMTGVSGDTASAATDAGNPVKIGGLGKTANPTAVTDGQRVNAIFDKLGKQVVVNSIRDLKGVQQTTITSSTAETTIVTAVASTFLDLYSLILTNTSASGTKVTIKDDTAGTTRAVIYVPANETRGFTLTESAAIPQAVVNKPWTATCGTSVASLEVTALYVKNT